MIRVRLASHPTGDLHNAEPIGPVIVSASVQTDELQIADGDTRLLYERSWHGGGTAVGEWGMVSVGYRAQKAGEIAVISSAAGY